MATSLHRIKGEQFFDDNGDPLAGGKLYYYEATTTNPQDTFSASTGAPATNSNPLILDASGRLQSSVFFGDSTSYSDYKELLTDANDVAISNWPVDNLPAAQPSAAAAAFAPPLFPWTQVTSGASPVALTAADAGNAYEADTTSGNIEFDLPSAASVGDGKGFVFKKTAAANSMIIDPDGSETIDNSSTSVTITELNQVIAIFSNGAEWYVAWRYIIAVTIPTVQRFTSGTAQTYTPAAGVRYIRVRMVGGGGGGGAVATNAGGFGTDSSFGGWFAGRGVGGAAAQETIAGANGGAGGSGGASGTGTLITRINGQQGGSLAGVGTSGVGGYGGSSVFGGGAAAMRGNGGAGLNAQANTGSGGGGGHVSASNGGDGGGAGEYVEFFVSAPSPTTYTVGAGGAGGAAGTQPGGNGAAGIIIVEEFY